MKFEKNLVHGRLIRRYKRFLADIELDGGKTITAHCTNSGSMKSCIEENAEVYLSENNNPARKTRYTWEMIKINNNWVGVNTMIPNKLAFESIAEQKIPELSGYNDIEREKTFANSRFDLKLSSLKDVCYVEVKNVTMKVGNNARFPDAVTLRGKKHLQDLVQAKKSGLRAVMLYIVQRNDVAVFRPAAEIDPNYANKLKEAFQEGVEILVYRAIVNPKEIVLGEMLPFYI